MYTTKINGINQSTLLEIKILIIIPRKTTKKIAETFIVKEKWLPVHACSVGGRG